MRQSTRIIGFVGTILLVGVVLSAAASDQPADLRGARLVVETTSAFKQGDAIAVHFAGRLATNLSDPKQASWVGEFRSLASGEVLGTMTHEVTCLEAAALPCPVLDAVNTFNFPDGSIVSRARESLPPDPGHPGFFLSGIHPDGKNIVSASGAFAGRTGRAHMSGRHDGRELPGFVTFDDFWLIELDPKP